MTRSPRRRFAYQLAVKLGRANVDAMLRSITARQFMEWEEYARLEPFTELRADYRTASIVKMLYDVNRSKESKTFTLDDFLLKFGQSQVDETPELTRRQNHLSMMKAIALVYSAKKAEDVT